MQAKEINYDKVKRAVIDPMVNYFGMRMLSDDQIKAYVDDLGRFSEQALDAAWREVRLSCKTRPTIAHFMEHLKAERQSSTVISNPQDRKEYFCHANTALAERLMRSPIGQMALERGVGLSIWIGAWRDGKANYTEADIRKAVAAREDTVAQLGEFKRKDWPLFQALLSAFEAMDARERQLQARFAGAA
ncbi:hypothetical protein [Tautonia plasticadhaerens]|uniref:Uncharacterized protein n=1 Tax=Tautonia plasticadhaerens TaxID=2527974 RepID=A0A518H258_9BACT|nr:hypothetical protein [Tautonia plasticadhaerens]QDV34928.1 hypothetical protein ElP_28250 [Tautonia plasticadhaerens]